MRGRQLAAIVLTLLVSIQAMEALAFSGTKQATIEHIEP